MRKTFQELQKDLEMDSLVDMVRQKLLSLPDPRNRIISHSFHDIVMSAFAAFHFKYPSINRFQSQTVAEKSNLKELFKIDKLCTDTHLRTVLDQIDPTVLRELYPRGIELLSKVGVLRDYAVPGKLLICSIDGVQHFCSSKVHCPHCHVRKHKNGTVTYSHSMLGAALVHPDQREVFIMDTEPIIKQDGKKKNDCELNAAKRLLDSLSEKYKKYNLLIVEDALYANGPHLRDILSRNWQFVVNIKPDSQKTLFQSFEGRKARNQVKTKEFRDRKGTTHRFWFSNDLALNNSHSDLRVNVLFYEEEKKNGKIQRFSWATSIKLNARNVERIMRTGRSRWKIENETFNTLKNQGYSFDHNFGHGSNFLATSLAFLTCLAFQTDQIFQRCNENFQKIWKKAGTKAKVWDVIRSIFTVKIVYSFKELYLFTAEQFFVQLE